MTKTRSVRACHPTLCGFVCCAALVSAVLAPAVVARADDGYEAAGVVAAADYLPAELMKGPEWTVAADAVNDGLDNTYTLESRFGEWEARGEQQVATRISEITALARLEEVSKTKVFLDAVGASVTAPIRLVRAVAHHPKETLHGLPRGISRWFRRTSFKVRETYHDVSEEIKEERARRAQKKAAAADGSEEAAAEAERAAEEKRRELEGKAETVARQEALDFLRISRAERHWYRELGVDPSTDNELVRNGVKSVARVEGLTSFGMTFVTLLPGIPYADIMRTSLDLVWSTNPGDLRVANRKRIREAGLSTETARAFEDGVLTLTQQTAFLEAMEALRGVVGREQLFALALDLETPEEARALTAVAILLADLHRAGTPLAEVLPGSALPVAVTRAGGLVVAANAGAVFYTQEVGEGWLAFTEIHAGHPANERRLYVTGITSERFDAEAKLRGWEVTDRFRPDPPAPHGQP